MKKLSILNFPFSTQVGFTLVELLLYMGILAIFMSVLAGLFGITIDLQLEANANTSVDRDAQFILNRIMYDIHRADSVVSPATAGVPDNALTIAVGGVSVVYTLDGSGNLTYTDNTGSFVLNGYDTKISNLSFTKIGNTGGVEDTVRVGMTVTSAYLQRKGYETRDFQTTIGIRR